MGVWPNLLKGLLCKQSELQIKITEGFASKLEIYCTNCNEEYNSTFSKSGNRATSLGNQQKHGASLFKLGKKSSRVGICFSCLMVHGSQNARQVSARTLYGRSSCQAKYFGVGLESGSARTLCSESVLS